MRREAYHSAIPPRAENRSSPARAVILKMNLAELRVLKQQPQLSDPAEIRPEQR
jgi:hypothetical protein